MVRQERGHATCIENSFSQQRQHDDSRAAHSRLVAIKQFSLIIWHRPVGMLHPSRRCVFFDTNHKQQFQLSTGTQWQQLLQSHLKTRATTHGAGRPSCGGYIFPTSQVKLSRTNQEQHGPAWSGRPALRIDPALWAKSICRRTSLWRPPRESIFWKGVFSRTAPLVIVLALHPSIHPYP